MNDNEAPRPRVRMTRILGEVSADGFTPAGDVVELAAIPVELLHLYRPPWRRDDDPSD